MDKLMIYQLPPERLQGKRVFLRIDIDGEPTDSEPPIDEDKLRDALPTLDYLTSAGARVVLGTHIGNPAGTVVEGLRLNTVAQRLSSLARKPVGKLDDVTGADVLRAVEEMSDGDIVLLENLCFHPGEQANDAHFAHQLADLADVYCNDAFSLANRSLASTLAITHFVKPAAAGIALSRELMMFETVLDHPESPVLGIIGGARIDEKLPILENILPELDTLFIGGALALTFLKAKGYEVGSAPVDEPFLLTVEDFLWKAHLTGTELLLPQDFIVVDAVAYRAYEQSGRTTAFPELRHVLDRGISPRDLPVDIGFQTLEQIKKRTRIANTILWNGPLGVCEVEAFATGTRQVARDIIDRAGDHVQHTVICGDSLTRALRKSNLRIEQIRHLSTGGKAALDLLAGKPLPAVVALDDARSVIGPIEKRIRRLLLAVDESEDSMEAVGRIAEFLDAEGVEIHLLHVHNAKKFLGEDLWLDSETRTKHEIERRYQVERVFTAANAALARQGLISYRQFSVEGDPADEILRCSEEIGADLVVIGSHTKRGVRKLVMGSVSRKVTNQSKCPVLIVRRPAPETQKIA